ncbi:MAG TPA: hypothetical protein VLI54_00205 [Bacillota bacterium]|nr:hypothetical protein [Bacillota bacterium]
MYRRYLHHLWARIRPVKTWYFLVITIVCALTCAFALRANYQQMIQLRQAVYATDQQNGNVVQSLQTLRAYVGSHMNTTLATAEGVYPPIQLKYTYERLRQAEKARADLANSVIYTDAQHHCEALYPSSFSGGPRVPCIEQYVKEHASTPKAIPDAMYKFDFASPRWSPDLAGWSLVFAIIFGVLTVLRFGVGMLLEKLTR